MRSLGQNEVQGACSRLVGPRMRSRRHGPYPRSCHGAPRVTHPACGLWAVLGHGAGDQCLCDRASVGPQSCCLLARKSMFRTGSKGMFCWAWGDRGVERGLSTHCNFSTRLMTP